MKAPASPRLMTSPAICADLGISRWTWARWVRTGKAPAPVSDLPGWPKWRRADVDRFSEGLFKVSGRSFFTSTRRRHDEQAALTTR